jgi:hypothetical protein
MPPAQQHSPTSVGAAKAVEPRADTLRRAVLDYLRSRGADGATDEEISDALGMNRRIELMQVRLVKNSGRTRLSRAGRPASVWVAVTGDQ